MHFAVQSDADILYFVPVYVKLRHRQQDSKHLKQQ